VRLTVGSLFSGIGGFDLGFQRAGFEIKWQVEIDPFCRRVLEKHWPGVKRYSDVRHLHAPEPAWVDVVCGGFPCQDISDAGKRAGIDGERSGLWAEFARLIRELEPRYIVVENVAALLGRGLSRVLGDLAESGYDAEWDCLPASAVGAPHRRDRIWIVAYADSRRRRQRHPSERFLPIPHARRDDADAVRDGCGQGREGGALRIRERHEGLSRRMADSGCSSPRTNDRSGCDGCAYLEPNSSGLWRMPSPAWASVGS
jgi:DNA-cytosine methyltransferase